MSKKSLTLALLTIAGSLCFAQNGTYEVVNPSTFLNEKVEKFVNDHIVEGVITYTFKHIDGVPVIEPNYDEVLDNGERPSKESEAQLRELMTTYVQMFIPEAWRDEVPEAVTISDTAIIVTNRHQDTLAHYTVASVRQQSNGNYKFNCDDVKRSVLERHTDRIWLLKIDNTVYQVVLKQ